MRVDDDDNDYKQKEGHDTRLLGISTDGATGHEQECSLENKPNEEDKYPARCTGDRFSLTCGLLWAQGHLCVQLFHQW